MPLYNLNGQGPTVPGNVFVAPSADIVGQVVLGEQVSIWFGAVLRGDTERLEVGAGSNVQDGAVLHADPGFPCILESDVTVGHRAIVHGAYCGAGSLVGMGAIMLNGSRLGAGSVLAAGALLPEGAEVPAGMLAMGVPARVVRPVAANENAARYIEQGQRYLKELQPVQSGLVSPELKANQPTKEVNNGVVNND